MLWVRNDRHGERIERCDSCQVFKSDAAAAKHCFKVCRQSDRLVFALQAAFSVLLNLKDRGYLSVGGRAVAGRAERELAAARRLGL